jgi:hypothetical protein
VAPEGLEESGQEDSTSKLEFRSPTLDPASLEVQTVTPDDSPMFLKKKPPESDLNLKKDEEIKKKLIPQSQENYFTSPSKDEEKFPVNFHEEENQNCMKNVQENKLTPTRVQTTPERSPNLTGWNVLSTPLRAFNVHMTRAIDSILRPNQKRQRHSDTPPKPDNSGIPKKNDTEIPGLLKNDILGSPPETPKISRTNFLDNPPETPRISENFNPAETPEFFSPDFSGNTNEDSNIFSDLNPPNFSTNSPATLPPNSVFRKPPPNSHNFFDVPPQHFSGIPTNMPPPPPGPPVDPLVYKNKNR